MEDNGFVDKGRPYCGLVFLWNNNLPNIRYIGYSPNKRIMTLLIRVEGSYLCLRNVYFPYVDKKADYEKKLSGIYILLESCI